MTKTMMPRMRACGTTNENDGIYPKDGGIMHVAQGVHTKLVVPTDMCAHKGYFQRVRGALCV